MWCMLALQDLSNAHGISDDVTARDCRKRLYHNQVDLHENSGIKL
jgi:hypothetical protein